MLKKASNFEINSVKFVYLCISQSNQVCISLSFLVYSFFPGVNSVILSPCWNHWDVCNPALIRTRLIFCLISHGTKRSNLPHQHLMKSRLGHSSHFLHGIELTLSSTWFNRIPIWWRKGPYLPPCSFMAWKSRCFFLSSLALIWQPLFSSVHDLCFIPGLCVVSSNLPLGPCSQITEQSFSLQLGSPRSQCWQGWLLLRPLSVACGWPPCFSVLIWSSLQACAPLASLCMSEFPLLVKKTSHVLESALILT